jgi:hypothetical protein
MRSFWILLALIHAWCILAQAKATETRRSAADEQNPERFCDEMDNWWTVNLVLRTVINLE